MPALDQCHDQVVRALQKEGWIASPKPERLNHEQRVIFIDLRATKRINGTTKQILLAEIKCFRDPDSATRDLYTGLGQYLIYRAMLEERGINIPLYLVVPLETYELLFDSTVTRAVTSNHVKLIVVNMDTDEIVLWKA